MRSLRPAWVVIVAALAACAAGRAGGGGADKPTAVTVDELAKEFARDGEKATEKYRGKRLWVTGYAGGTCSTRCT